MFWQGREADNVEEDDEWTVEDFEDYIHSVHDEISLSNVCGFD